MYTDHTRGARGWPVLTMVLNEAKAHVTYKQENEDILPFASYTFFIFPLWNTIIVLDLNVKKIFNIIYKMSCWILFNGLHILMPCFYSSFPLIPDPDHIKSYMRLLSGWGVCSVWIAWCDRQSALELRTSGKLHDRGNSNKVMHFDIFHCVCRTFECESFYGCWFLNSTCIKVQTIRIDVAACLGGFII